MVVALKLAFRPCLLDVFMEILGCVCPMNNVCIHQQVKVTRDELEDLLVSEILDGHIKGRIDQVGGFLELKAA